ncbi:MAG: hypothetical protein IPI16_17460 [Comamonadaceae bacterium]|nr:hypothetical protein [Comamonadaceae bacterium]
MSRALDVVTLTGEEYDAMQEAIERLRELADSEGTRAVERDCERLAAQRRIRMTTQASSASPLDIPVMPVAWLHDQPERYDVVHDEARALWLKAWPKQVEHYTIPLYRHAERQPLSTEAACALLKDALGIDPMLDGNMLKMLRAVERAHGIGHNA